MKVLVVLLGLALAAPLAAQSLDSWEQERHNKKMERLLQEQNDLQLLRQVTEYQSPYERMVEQQNREREIERAVGRALEQQQQQTSPDHWSNHTWRKLR